MCSRMNGAIPRAVALVLTTFVVSAVANAQRLPNERTGLMLGVHSIAAPGVTLTGADFGNGYGTSFGAGAGVMIGYAFNRTLSSFVSFDVARQKTAPNEADEGTFGLGHLEFGVRAKGDGWAAE